ncbi:MAG TPA: phosphocholine cytidylyltransferase family protein [Planctomycetaceae bacterium]|nr:phosphocholine cytidylyltransferase family protein [Planctomycetaceae bacterium]
MRGLVLAAGAGRRLGALGADRPKCLVEVGGRTLLDWQHAALTGAGIHDLAIVSGYRAEQLPQRGWTRFHNPRFADTGVIASLMTARDWLEVDDCIVSYADIVYGPETIAALQDTPGDIAMTSYSQWRALWEARFADPLTDAETFRTDARGQLLEIGQRATSLDEIQGQFMGLVKFTPAGFSLAAKHVTALGTGADRLDMTSLLRGLIEQGVPVQTRTVDGFWYEVDNSDDAAFFPEWAARQHFS